MTIAPGETVELGRIAFQGVFDGADLDPEQQAVRGQGDVRWNLVATEDEIVAGRSLADYVGEQIELVARYAATTEEPPSREPVEVPTADEAESVRFRVAVESVRLRQYQLYLRRGPWVGVLTMTTEDPGSEQGQQQRTDERWSGLLRGVAVLEASDRQRNARIHDRSSMEQALRTAAASGQPRIPLARPGHHDVTLL